MDGNPPKRMYFNTDALPERDRFPMYCEEIVRRYAGLDLRTEDSSRFYAALELQRVGGIVVAHSSNSPVDSIRTPSFVRDGDDALCVILLESGSSYQTQRGTDQSLVPGEAIVCDCGYPGAHNYIADSRSWCIKIPRRKITELLSPDIRLTGAKLDRDVTIQRLLFGYLKGSFDVDLRNSKAASQLYEDHIVDLVALALGAEGEFGVIAQERGARAARRSAVLREIERRSGDPSLSAITIALSLGITPRYVHLLLEETGKSFTHHVLERRLEKSVALLRDPLWRNRKIADVAAEAGFTDLSYFNRAFRRHYGATPSDIRAAAQRAD
jgi:AraC-like DNA-binding protein